MRPIGFSTGAIAKGDFREGIVLQQSCADAVELSALRESELDTLIEAIPRLKLDHFRFISFHAPSRLVQLGEAELVERLREVVEHVNGVVVHPDIIEEPALWKTIGASILLENLDQRKSCARTTREMVQYFDALPEARFCLDLGHARQVDPTLSIAVEFLQTFPDRLAEIHISEVDASSAHLPISSAAMNSFRQISSLIPRDLPAIVESIIPAEMIADEIEMVRASLGDTTALHGSESMHASEPCAELSG